MEQLVKWRDELAASMRNLFSQVNTSAHYTLLSVVEGSELESCKLDSEREGERKRKIFTECGELLLRARPEISEVTSRIRYCSKNLLSRNTHIFKVNKS